MIYNYSVTHSHGEAFGSVEASSSIEVEQLVRDMYHGLDFPTSDTTTDKDGKLIHTNYRTEKTEVFSVTVTEAA